MTPFQYHFPYFIDLHKFNAELAAHQWQARVLTPQGNNESERILLEQIDISNVYEKERPSIRFEFGTFLMVHSYVLYAWRRYEDGLLIRQYDLRDADPGVSVLEEFIDIIATDPGRHSRSTNMTYQHFVTFIRKPNLLVKEEFHERYVIVLLHENIISLIPFDSFNETGGDPLYLWPALATLDTESGKLHGLGMRMGSFTVQL